MWQRFTESARKVIFFSQEEAQRFGEGYVSTEHMLLGLVKEDGHTAVRILDAMGVSLSRVRAEVEKNLPRGDARPSQDMTLTPRAKRVIDLAYDEARDLNNNFIGTEHLLLGLIREGDGIAGRVLEKLGVALEEAKKQTLLLQKERPAHYPEEPTRGESRTSTRIGGETSPRKLTSIFSSIFRGLVTRAAAEEVDQPLVAAATLASEASLPMAPAYLAIMALQSPSRALVEVFESFSLDPSDAAGILIGVFANVHDEPQSKPVLLNEILHQAIAEMRVVGHKELLDAHLILAMLKLKAPLVSTVFEPLGIDEKKFRAALAKTTHD